MGILYVLQQQCLIMGDVFGATRGLRCARLHVVPHVVHSFIHSLHYAPSNPQSRCAAADILWQPSSLPCLGISSTK